MISKKGMVIEALMRVIIMIVLVVVVIKIGEKTADAFFGGSDAQQIFDEFINQINSLQNKDSKPFLISLDVGTGIIAFSKDASEFRCYACDNTVISNTIHYYSFKKPSNNECDKKPCACLCTKGLTKGNYEGDESKMMCNKLYCKNLKSDIPAKISLEEVLKKKNIAIATYPYWQNGFFFSRGNTETPFNGITLANDARNPQVFIEKKIVNGKEYVAACPSSSCIQDNLLVTSSNGKVDK